MGPALFHPLCSTGHPSAQDQWLACRQARWRSWSSKSFREHREPQRAAVDGRTLIETHVARVEVYNDHLIIHAEAGKNDHQTSRAENFVCVSWQKTASERRREILIPQGITRQQVRPIRSENRATLVASIARGRRWLAELIADPTASP